MVVGWGDCFSAALEPGARKVRPDIGAPCNTSAARMSSLLSREGVPQMPLVG
jgi:hypothetical protein